MRTQAPDPAAKVEVVGRISFGVRSEGVHGAHETVTLFAGETPDSRGNCGKLTLRTQEADELRRYINAHEALVTALDELLSDVLCFGSSSITLRPSIGQARDALDVARY